MAKKHLRSEENLPVPPFLTGDDKRTVILRAAHKLFLQDGYSVTSMDAVTQEAGVSKATVYAHFESKQKLFEGLIQIGSENGLKVIMKQLVRRGGDPRDELIAFFEPLLEMIFSGGYAWNRMLIAEAQRHPENARLFYESAVEVVTRTVAEYLTSLAREGLFTAPDMRRAADALQDMVLGGPIHRVLMLGPQAVDYRATLRFGVDLLLRSGSCRQPSEPNQKERSRKSLVSRH